MPAPAPVFVTPSWTLLRRPAESLHRYSLELGALRTVSPFDSLGIPENHRDDTAQVSLGCAGQVVEQDSVQYTQAQVVEDGQYTQDVAQDVQYGQDQGSGPTTEETIAQGLQA